MERRLQKRPKAIFVETRVHAPADLQTSPGEVGTLRGGELGQDMASYVIANHRSQPWVDERPNSWTSDWSKPWDKKVNHLELV